MMAKETELWVYTITRVNTHGYYSNVGHVAATADDAIKIARDEIGHETRVLDDKRLLAEEHEAVIETRLDGIPTGYLVIDARKVRTAP
jgi:hypothetical protein